MDKSSSSTSNDAEKADEVYLNYDDDPQRSTLLKINSDKPFNAETPQVELVKQFITPTASFFVRSHGPVPTLDGKKHKYVFVFNLIFFSATVR